jgi:hypothetical protein
MPDIKQILELPEKTSPDGSDWIAIQEAGGGSGSTKRVPASTIAAVSALGGGANLDLSVNMAKAYINSHSELILECDKKHTGQVSGNFNGGGSGNKPLFMLPGYEGRAMADFPVLDLLTELRTIDDTDEQKLGVSFNALIDLAGDGSAGIAVMVITNTLSAGGGDAPGGEVGASASIHTFDIGAYSDSGTTASMINEFFIVGNLPGTGTGNAAPGGNPSWTSNPINLDILLNGGTMPVTGNTFSPAYPSAKLVACMTGECISDDGGLPVGARLNALWAQLGGSGNAKRAVTAITSFLVDGESILP